MVALIQSKNHTANKGKMADRYQFDTHPTGIGLRKWTQTDTKVTFHPPPTRELFLVSDVYTAVATNIHTPLFKLLL